MLRQGRGYSNYRQWGLFRTFRFHYGRQKKDGTRSKNVECAWVETSIAVGFQNGRRSNDLTSGVETARYKGCHINFPSPFIQPAWEAKKVLQLC